MKNSTFKKLLSAVIFVALSCNVSMAIEYCHYPVTTTPGTFYLTCKTTGTNQYELILETDVPMLSVGNNIYLRIDGGTATNLGQFAVFSPDRKTVTMAFTSTALPYDMHGQIGIEFQTGNNWGYANWPPNVDWTATCGGGEDDEEAPVMQSATAGSIDAFSAVLTLTATDNVGVTLFVVTGSGINRTFPKDAGNTYNLNGLTPSTTYNLSVTAKDAAGNVSAPMSIPQFSTLEAQPVTDVSNYCQAPLNATNNSKMIMLTLQQPVEQNYQIKIEADEDITGLGGSFCHINGTAQHQLNAAGNFTIVNSRTIVCNIISTTAPSLYTPLHVIFANGGQSNFDFPTGVTWGVCPTLSGDTVPPVMISAEVVSITHNSAIIAVEATDEDNDGNINPVTRFMVAVNPTEFPPVPNTNYVAVDGQIEVRNLIPGTSFQQILIWAKDGANPSNISENFVLVQVNTPPFQSACSGAVGHHATPENKKISYIISYDNNEITYTVTSLNAADPLVFLEVQQTHNLGDHAATVTGGVGNHVQSTIRTGETLPLPEGTVIGIRFLYRLQSMPGNEMNSLDPDINSPNIILYQIGQCPYNDTVPPTMGTASFIGADETSAVIIVNATDNVTNPVTKFMISISGADSTQYIANAFGEITINNLLPSTSYTLRVWAKDDAGNVSLNYAPVGPFTTLASTDQTPPVMVSADFVSATQNSAIIAVYATDNVTSPVIKFMAAINGLPEAELTATGGQITLNGLQPETEYTAVIRAKDAAGNISTNSIPVTFSTACQNRYGSRTDKYCEGDDIPTIAYPYEIIKPIGNGCDSIITVTLEIISADISVTLENNVLTANQANAQYQWYGCVDNEPTALIENATNRSFTPTESGDYSVKITYENCDFYSECKNVTITGINTVSESSISIFPIVVVDNVNISSQSTISKVAVYDMLGQMVLDKNIEQNNFSINLSSLNSGLYIILIETNNEKFSQKIIKK